MDNYRLHAYLQTPWSGESPDSVDEKNSAGCSLASEDGSAASPAAAAASDRNRMDGSVEIDDGGGRA